MNTKYRSVVLLLLITMIGANQGIAQEVGIQLYSLRNQFSKNVPETLKLIKSWGITTIEGGENTYGLEQSHFIDLLKKYNLNTVSVGTNQDELRDNPQMVVDRAKAFGAKYAMCPWILHKGNNFTIKDVQKAVAIFNTSGKLLRENGINLVYHIHGYEFRPYKNGTLFDYMVENSKNFDFEMDVFWTQHGGEDPLKLLKKYPSKFKLMHLKDMEKGIVGDNTGGADDDTNVVLGTGSIDIKSIVLKARELGIKYMFIEDESTNVENQVPESLEFLKTILK
nr:sugar phosphate isomerase/epimerase [uncultured Allomuricauda sp.]